eukprot:7598117-Pyramimonas_sp.AAC.1
MAFDEQGNVAVVWALLSRLRGRLAVAAASEAAHATGNDVLQAGGFGRNLHPGWVVVSYQDKPAIMAPAVADGWQRPPTSLTTILHLCRGTKHLGQCSEEIDIFSSVNTAGKASVNGWMPRLRRRERLWP